MMTWTWATASAVGEMVLKWEHGRQSGNKFAKHKGRQGAAWRMQAALANQGNPATYCQRPGQWNSVSRSPSHVWVQCFTSIATLIPVIAHTGDTVIIFILQMSKPSHNQIRRLLKDNSVMKLVEQLWNPRLPGSLTDAIGDSETIHGIFSSL